MTTKSRIDRRALIRGATLATAAAAASIPTIAAASPLVAGADAELFARIADFNPINAAANAAWEQASRLREVIDAMPDCPPLGASGDPFSAFLEKHGGSAAYDKANRLNEQSGAAVQAVMSTPARTVAGALAKLRIVARAYGRGPGDEDHDENLISWQWGDDNWLAATIAELERLAAVTTGA